MSLECIQPDADGFDIGGSFHFVAVPQGRDTETVKKFGCFTEDLHAIADWLIKCHIKTAAMEARGVYWIPLFEVLEARGIEVCLVNSRHVKNVSGRKSDVLDCQCIQHYRYKNPEETKAMTTIKANLRLAIKRSDRSPNNSKIRVAEENSSR